MNILGHSIDDEIELSIVKVSDAQALFDLIDSSRERLGRWLGFVADTLQPSDVEAFIAAVRKAYAAEESYTFAIRFRGQVAGIVSVVVSAVQNSGEIGYWIGADFEGKGVVTKAVRAVTEFAFEELRLHRVAIYVAVPNERSANVAMRAGFRFEGVLRGAARVGDTYYDAKVFALLAADA